MSFHLYLIASGPVGRMPRFFIPFQDTSGEAGDDPMESITWKNPQRLNKHQNHGNLYKGTVFPPKK